MTAADVSTGSFTVASKYWGLVLFKHYSRLARLPMRLCFYWNRRENSTLPDGHGNNPSEVGFNSAAVVLKASIIIDLKSYAE